MHGRATLGMTLAFLFVKLSMPAFANSDDHWSANYWLPLCQNPKHPICLGYMEALADVNSILSPDKPLFCAPQEVTIGQMRAIIVAAVEKEPAQWHMPFVVLGYEALGKAFPCKK